MKIKEGFIIKKLGIGYIVVTVGDASMDFNGVIRLNETGAFLWQSIQDGADSREKLIQAMLDRYEDLDQETAKNDLDEFLGRVAFAVEE
jgi:hypothetical protein